MRGWMAMAAALLLVACGGGGGGDAPTGLQVDASSLQLKVTQGEQPGTGAQTINARLTGAEPNGSVYIGAEVSGGGLIVPLDVKVDLQMRTGTVTVSPDISARAGTYRGTVTLLACSDAYCKTHLQGSPHKLSYTATVLPRFMPNVDSLSFSAAETQTPAAQNFWVQLPADATAATHQVNDTEGSNWLQVSGQGTLFTVQPRPDLLEGSYSADIVLTANAGQQRTMVQVSHRVSKGLAVPSDIVRRVDSATQPDELSGPLQIDVVPGAAASAWVVSSNQPWLRIDNPQAGPNSPARWAIDPEGFAKLPNDATAQAVITVDAGPTLVKQTLKFSLTKDVPQIDAVDASNLQAGVAGEVELHGHDLLSASVLTPGFSHLGTKSKFGLSSTTLSVPALPVGRYPVTVALKSGLPTPTRYLEVKASLERVAAAWPSYGGKGAVVWDSLSQSAFVRDKMNDAVLRFQLGSMGDPKPVSASSASVPGLIGLALRPGAEGVVVATRAGQVITLDPQDLSVLRSVQTGKQLTEGLANLPLMLMYDNTLFLSESTSAVPFNLRSERVLTDTLTGGFDQSIWGIVSSDRQQALAVLQPAGRNAAIYFRRGSGGFVSIGGAPLRSFGHASSNREGTRWVLDGGVHGSLLVAEGKLTPPDGWSGLEAAMSRDGTRTYLFTRSSTGGSSKIWVFDTSVAVAANAAVPVLGSIDLLAEPSCTSAETTTDCDGNGTRMILIDEGRSLLAVGDRHFVVVPVPAALRGAAAPSQSVKAPHVLARAQ